MSTPLLLDLNVLYNIAGGFCSSPLLCGRKLIFLAALSEHRGACYFGPLSPLLPWPLGHVCLISFLV